MPTELTAAGITLAINATQGTGPKINVTHFKIGPTINPPPPPVQGDLSTDITDSVYTGTSLQYAVVDNNTVEYIVTLDETVGNPPFSVARIGLFTDNGDGTSTLLSITSTDAPNPDYKFQTSGNIVGDRLTYAIYIAISNMSEITNFTIPLLPLVSVPESSDEKSLPDPMHVVFNTSQVIKHSIMRVPSIAYRETPSQGRVNPAWIMSPERLIAGQGEGVVPVVSTSFDTLATIGTVVGLDYTNQKMIVGEPASNKYILGIRSSLEEITNYGIYVDSVNTYSPMQRLFAGTGVNAGKLTTIQNQWPIGYALGPVSTQNAVGYLCWIDFTTGTFSGGGQAGPPGPQGPQGLPGTGGGPSIFSNPAQCYLRKTGTNLVLIPYNGNKIIINDVIQYIPAGGVALPPTGLNPNTLYYIYAFMSSGVMYLEASTVVHATSTFDGIDIKGADQTRTLVGMAYTVAGPAWIDSSRDTSTTGNLCVLSWFNRRLKSCTTALPTDAKNSANAPIELSTAARNYFIVWANSKVKYVSGGYQGGNGGNGVCTTMNFDGVTYESAAVSVVENGARGAGTFQGPNGVHGVKRGLAEGRHFATMMGTCFGGGPGAGYWNTNLNIKPGSTGPALPNIVIPAPTTLTVTVEG